MASSTKVLVAQAFAVRTEMGSAHLGLLMSSPLWAAFRARKIQKRLTPAWAMYPPEHGLSKNSLCLIFWWCCRCYTSVMTGV